jgi:hypothetical protein
MSVPPSTRTYGISPRRRNVLIAAGLLITLPLLLAGLLASDPALLGAGALVTAIIGPIFVLAIRSARLVVSEHGIELRQLGARVTTSWDNVAGLRLDRGREGLVLHRPLAGAGAERLAAAASVTFQGAWLEDPERRALIMEQRLIPIEAFAYWIEHGDLRAILTARVPALSAPEAWRPPAPPKLPPWRVALIVAIILAAMGAGAVLALASPATQLRAQRILAIPAGLAIAVYALANAGAAVRFWRRGRYGWSVLWSAMAAVQALVVVAILGWLLRD